MATYLPRAPHVLAPCAETGASKSRRRKLRDRRVAIRHAQCAALGVRELLGRSGHTTTATTTTNPFEVGGPSGQADTSNAFATQRPMGLASGSHTMSAEAVVFVPGPSLGTPTTTLYCQRAGRRTCREAQLAESLSTLPTPSPETCAAVEDMISDQLCVDITSGRSSPGNTSRTGSCVQTCASVDVFTSDQQCVDIISGQASPGNLLHTDSCVRTRTSVGDFTDDQQRVSIDSGQVSPVNLSHTGSRAQTRTSDSATIAATDSELTGRTYLKVPYNKKQLAKSLGVRYDLKRNQWYVGPNFDMSSCNWERRAPKAPCSPEDF